MRNGTIVNQQATEAELGWLAGIIDGEGSISMNIRKKSWNGWNGIGVDLSVLITNTDSGIIDKASDIIEAINITPHIFERKTRPEYKDVLVLNITKMCDILKLLNILQSYLAGEKRTRARLISKFIKRRLERKGLQSSKKGTSWYDKYDWELVQEFYKITGGKLLPEVSEVLNEHTFSPQNVE